MKKVDVENNVSANNILIIAKGSVFSAVITLILLFIYSCILAYTNVPDTTIPLAVIVLTIISILIGSSLATKSIKNNGLINGSLVGGIYVISLYILSSFLDTGFAFNFYSVLMIITGVIAGGVGGIFGVNLKR